MFYKYHFQKDEEIGNVLWEGNYEHHECTVGWWLTTLWWLCKLIAVTVLLFILLLPLCSETTEDKFSAWEEEIGSGSAPEWWLEIMDLGSPRSPLLLLMLEWADWWMSVLVWWIPSLLVRAGSLISQLGWTVSRWRLRSTFLWKALSHIPHSKGLYPVCLRMWVMRLEDWLKDLPHTTHLCGFSPENKNIKY